MPRCLGQRSQFQVFRCCGGPTPRLWDRTCANDNTMLTPRTRNRTGYPDFVSYPNVQTFILILYVHHLNTAEELLERPGLLGSTKTLLLKQGLRTVGMVLASGGIIALWFAKSPQVWDVWHAFVSCNILHGLCIVQSPWRCPSAHSRPSTIDDTLAIRMTFDRVSAILFERIVCNPLTRSAILSETVRGHERCVD